MSIFSKLFGKSSSHQPEAKELRGAATSVFRLDENNVANLLPEAAAELFILFGPLAEDGLTVAMNDVKNRVFPSVIIAKRSASLLKLPKSMKRCFIKHRYPTKNMGGLNAGESGAMEAWHAYFNKHMSDAIIGKINNIPSIVAVPSAGTGLIHISIIWGENDGLLSRDDVLLVAQALEQVLW